MKGKTFGERVVELALTIPRGRVSTYGDIARAAGGTPITAQSITGILGKAEQSGVKGIPWHRIIYSDGRVWVSDEYKEERMRLYKKEKIEIDDKGRVVNFDSIRF
ncbi:DNA methyltransferase [Candidatus Kaiserbacteria bacterium CG10_big_fil_rev_8_21_14_0_10_44_10]|uniref:DNA methyltransferase n=1 Tax=Candidatus Kaiserbacteria bacterium CG10_big_fil_rev_8_21_14_0_10_44_10 TaxID=1974606 RepID=A0A2H0UJG1_9BACT|nr:MAG: DNA methyltransferase [Candidatus Kaiserbacteria bacterium CG10_big_fil_rev_8_21_14_0_10_44_10]